MAGVLRGIETASTRLLVPAMVVVAAVVCLAASQRAQAAVIYELSPATSVGATSNFQSVSSGSASAFSTVSTSAVLRADWPTARYTLAARLGLTHYFAEGARDTISGGVTGTSSFDLTQSLGLSFGANGMVSRAATIDSAALAGQATLWNGRGRGLHKQILAGQTVAPAWGSLGSPSFLAGLTRSSRLTPSHMAMAAATNTEE